MAKKNKKHEKIASQALSDSFFGRELSAAVVSFDEAIATRLGISAAEWKCLGLLDRHGAMPASRLAALSGFTTGAMTGIVDRLEKSGVVRREAHPTDRRSVIIHPADLGRIRERVEPSLSSLSKAMSKLASGYSPSKLEAIANYMDLTTELLREETARLRRKKSKK